MVRDINNITNRNSLFLIIQKIKAGIQSTLIYYNHLYNEEELHILKENLKLCDNAIKDLENIDTIDHSKIYSILLLETELKELIFRTWQEESRNGFNYISWLKEDRFNHKKEYISATFSNDNLHTFCDSRVGIKYDVPIDGFLAACEKDAGSVLEYPHRKSIYTVGLFNNKIINSYNLATPIITPIQVFDKSNNKYESKHNEIILDSRYVFPLCVIYFNDDDLNFVNLVSSTYNIPIEKIEDSKKR